MKTLFYMAAGLLLSGWNNSNCFALDYSTLIPHTASSIPEFIPSGFALTSSAEGVIFPDNTIGRVLIIKNMQQDNTQECVDTDRYIVILRNQKENYQLFMTSDMLPCSRDGGIAGGVQVNIKNGVISISVFTGSRELTTEVFRYRYESPTDKFRLIGYDTSERDRALGKTISSFSINYLTNIQIRNGKQSPNNDRIKHYLQ